MSDLGKRTREHIYETAIRDLLAGLRGAVAAWERVRPADTTDPAEIATARVLIKNYGGEAT